MLSIYGKNCRPQEAIDAIIAATAEYPEKTLKKWQKIITADVNYIHIVISGEVEIRRVSDELSMFTMRSAGFLGVSSIYNKASYMYGIARDTTVIRTIRKDEFERLIGEKNLWPQFSQILVWYIGLLSKRDDILVARSAYSVVREFLLEINELIIYQNRDVNVYDYIQEYTNLARSTIIKILSDLKKGHYIVVEKGKLKNITSLPERY
ncbi:MAG: helix-turn-helix domain-containing protein [Leclercia adecarboxylata]|uniref:cAMP-binding protein n=1 Tax=Leclercia adecarboxylata TaxID=83655 RepID=A0AAP9DC88_9ENTR|nr:MULTISPECIES: helix-turn-helix domain-containing protein [Leclercia]HCN95716.1 cAMP-binding protein [Leclercia sp.]MDU1062661.1 helix-turn-helix domain-containing protein [Leclercia adecarboxylata]MDU4840121.1 helix-turn-helix domain-containing protein [Leclercia adecarboxylata]QDK19924.1 cAMP-binding protein [Leclercia adecarboxylata]QGU14549.1 cAMP-binding protein [Leclercia sp. 119287]